jgi:putative endonuclease
MNQIGIYILESTGNGRFYIGSTNCMERRLREHNSGKVTATHKLRPLRLRIFIPCQSLFEARRAEYRLKKYKSRKIIEKVIKSKILPWEFKKRDNKRGSD